MPRRLNQTVGAMNSWRKHSYASMKRWLARRVPILQAIRHPRHAVACRYEGWRDRPAVEKEFPALFDLEERHRVREMLEPAYIDYVTNYSTPTMAISLEAATSIGLLVEQLRPRSLLDLGSGYSTFVLALLAPHESKIVSVDDSGQWLAASERFLTRTLKRSREVRFSHWNDFDGAADIWKFIVVDFSDIARRVQCLEQMARNSNSLISATYYYDDFHKPQMRQVLRKCTNGCDYKLYSLRPVTSDMYGRFGALSWKSPGHES